MIRFTMLIGLLSLTGCAFAEGLMQIGALAEQTKKDEEKEMKLAAEQAKRDAAERKKADDERKALESLINAGADAKGGQVPMPAIIDAPAPKSPESAEAARKSKTNTHDVEVKFRDGSIVRGQLKNLDQITLKTSFGTLKIPLEDLHAVLHGAGGTDSKLISRTLEQFKGSDAALCKSAEEILEEQGSAAVEPLFDARAGAAPELKTRIDALLKRILAHAESVPAFAGDTVRAAKFDARGTLQLESFELSSKLGELNVKLSDIENIRWLSAGDNRSIDLDGNAALREWVDTGMDLTQGQTIDMKCSGMVNLFGNFNSTAAGNPNWNNQSFLVGSVVGKLGSDGDPFLIGDGTIFKASSSQRLYIKIFCTDEFLQNNRRCSGHYTVNIGAGALNDSAKSRD